MAPLSIRIARKNFDAADGTARSVIRDLLLDVSDREVVALLGPSGCGKSTLLNLVAGLDQDFEGLIDRGDSHRIGYVFQEPRLLPWRTVAENLLIPAGRDQAARRRVDWLLDKVGLAGETGRYPGELSLGMARRAALARALAIEPDILLLDEPFASLDTMTALQMRRIVDGLLAERRTTTLLVTHAMAEAEELGDRIVILSSAPARVVDVLPGRR